MAEIKPVKVFTRDAPCTKVHLWNCFRGVVAHALRFVARPVVEAQGEIGKNSAKHMIGKGYLVYRTVGNIDYYVLTAKGEAWLADGLAAHLRRHPDQASSVLLPVILLPGVKALTEAAAAPKPTPARRLLRTRPAA